MAALVAGAIGELASPMHTAHARSGSGVSMTLATRSASADEPNLRAVFTK